MLEYEYVFCLAQSSNWHMAKRLSKRRTDIDTQPHTASLPRNGDFKFVGTAFRNLYHRPTRTTFDA